MTDQGTAARQSSPEWFPPQGGDIALIERDVPGNKPVPIIVCWHYEDRAWWNATGVPGPMLRQPALGEFRELIVRKNRPVESASTLRNAVDYLASTLIPEGNDPSISPDAGQNRQMFSPPIARPTTLEEGTS